MQRHRVLTAAFSLLRHLISEMRPLKACVNFCSNLRPALPRTLALPRQPVCQLPAMRQSLSVAKGGIDVARQILVVKF